jgi:hypothetical protein
MTVQTTIRKTNVVGDALAITPASDVPIILEPSLIGAPVTLQAHVAVDGNPIQISSCTWAFGKGVARVVNAQQSIAGSTGEITRSDNPIGQTGDTITQFWVEPNNNIPINCVAETAEGSFPIAATMTILAPSALQSNQNLGDAVAAISGAALTGSTDAGQVTSFEFRGNTLAGEIGFIEVRSCSILRQTVDGDSQFYGATAGSEDGLFLNPYVNSVWAYGSSPITAGSEVTISFPVFPVPPPGPVLIFQPLPAQISNVPVAQYSFQEYIGSIRVAFQATDPGSLIVISSQSYEWSLAPTTIQVQDPNAQPNQQQWMFANGQVPVLTWTPTISIQWNYPFWGEAPAWE